MKGYLGADGDDAVYLDGGYLRTGDLGRIDGDGFVWLVGRRKDVVNCGGFKVLPEEVEEVLRSHPSVGDVMVAGVPDDRLGESPHAFVVLRPGALRDGNIEDFAAALIELAGRHLARYKVPRGVRVVDELPRTATGKLVRTRAAELLAGTQAAPVP
jgi:long-chain acyl-CoA synthetase